MTKGFVTDGSGPSGKALISLFSETAKIIVANDQFESIALAAQTLLTIVDGLNEGISCLIDEKGWNEAYAGSMNSFTPSADDIIHMTEYSQLLAE